ncbi:MAG: 2-oxoisovalerate dehydrogenase [Terriglobia bacterium]
MNTSIKGGRAAEKAPPELIFLVEEAPEGGYTARALGESIFTEADDLASFHEQVRDAVRCHVEDDQQPKVIQLHFVREEVIAV